MNPTEDDEPSQPANLEVGLLIRHRWLGNPFTRTYHCTAGIPSLYTTFDPLCFGCGAELSWDEVPEVYRFANVSNDRILGEELGVRLDLYLCERTVRRVRPPSRT